MGQSSASRSSACTKSLKALQRQTSTCAETITWYPQHQAMSDTAGALATRARRGVPGGRSLRGLTLKFVSTKPGGGLDRIGGSIPSPATYPEYQMLNTYTFYSQKDMGKLVGKLPMEFTDVCGCLCRFKSKIRSRA